VIGDGESRIVSSEGFDADARVAVDSAGIYLGAVVASAG
jgi:hypothetical protein